MSKLANNNEGDVLYLTLNKSDDQKDIDQDIEMDATENDNRGHGKGHGRGHGRGRHGRGRHGHGRGHGRDHGKGHGKKIKKDKKEKFKKGKKCKKDKETKRLEKNEKMTNKIVKLMDITKQKQAYHNNEAKLFGQQLTELENLLNGANGMDFKDLKRSLIQIIKKTKRERKIEKKMEKRGRKGANKGVNKDEKMKAKMLKRQQKLERKKAKMERKKQKLEKNKIMNNARIESLPDKMEEKECLEIFIDGYNIIGCDKICRKHMRSRGARLARQRLLELVYAFFQERNLNIGYQLIVHVWFDKNGKDFKYNNAINVVFSGKETVDDKWVNMFGKCDKLNNKLVITSDRELTVRLGNLGMKCMKSGVFYKKYLNSDNDKKIKKETNDEIVNMVIDGDAYEPDGDVETYRMADMDANNNDKSSTSEDDDDDDDEEGEDDIDEEFDIIEMELEGLELQPGAYPSPK